MKYDDDFATRTETPPRGAIQLPARLILDKSILQQIPAGVYLISTRLSDDGTPVFGGQAGSDLNKLWQDIVQSGAAGLDCLIIGDVRHFEILAGPTPPDGRTCSFRRHVEIRNLLINRLFPEPAAADPKPSTI